ncbi:MAG: sporulation transcriptional regulator SpoIIID [Clostridia bacterium]|nr:sporulation transcriptional regulator SpoIIID [Clostridia bacterium]
MNYDYEQRAESLGRYIIESKSTVRATAKKFGISKSTVHSDVTKRLRKINPELFSEVRKVLDVNKEERHIRGGIATREKYKREAISAKR